MECLACTVSTLTNGPSVRLTTPRQLPPCELLLHGSQSILSICQDNSAQSPWRQCAMHGPVPPTDKSYFSILQKVGPVGVERVVGFFVGPVVGHALRPLQKSTH